MFFVKQLPFYSLSIHVKTLPVQYEHKVYTTNYNEEEYKKYSTKKGHGNNKHQEPVYKSSISQARELQEHYDNMRSIQEYQEFSKKPHMAK
jgi:polysaccharide pyruvyl transferase WcaK-like protein